MAVYTHISDAQREELLSHYALGSCASCTPIQEGVENSNYLIVCHQESVETQYILTLFEKRMRLEDIPYFMELMQRLDAQGVPCPLPQRTKMGGLSLSADETSVHKAAAISSFLFGKSSPQLRDAQLFSLGKEVAKMHTAQLPESLRRENTMGHSYWPEMLEHIAPQAREQMPEQETAARKACDYIAAHWPSTLPIGVIHADLFPDNVFFEDEGNADQLSGIIDWYFACEDAYAYDLAIIMNAWCFDDAKEYVPERESALLKGYESARPLSKEEKKALPVLCLGAALRFWLSRAHDMIHHDKNALVKPKGPEEYFYKLQYFMEKV